MVEHFIWADLFSFWTQAGLKAELAMSRQKSRVHSRIVKTTRTLGVRRIKVEDISGLKHHSCLLTAAGMCGREWAQGWPVKLSCVGGGERNLVKTRNKTAETRGPGRLAAWPAWPGLVKCVSSGWWLGTWGWPLVPAYYSKVGQQPWQVRQPIMRGSAERQMSGGWTGAVTRVIICSPIIFTF